MTAHQRDRKANNPRIQCDVCGKWQRQHGYRIDPATGRSEMFYRFYGGCGYSNGGDHLAGRDVCDDCCHIACAKLAGASPTAALGTTE